MGILGGGQSGSSRLFHGRRGRLLGAILTSLYVGVSRGYRPGGMYVHFGHLPSLRIGLQRQRPARRQALWLSELPRAVDRAGALAARVGIGRPRRGAASGASAQCAKADANFTRQSPAAAFTRPETTNGATDSAAFLAGGNPATVVNAIEWGGAAACCRVSSTSTRSDPGRLRRLRASHVGRYGTGGPARTVQKVWTGFSRRRGSRSRREPGRESRSGCVCQHRAATGKAVSAVIKRATGKPVEAHAVAAAGAAGFASCRGAAGDARQLCPGPGG